jgi:prepilin-type N-terminal cleavage/methylation domain-containing protein
MPCVRPSRARRRRQAGFTLAELIVATTVLSIAMTAVYSLLYTSIAAWRQVDQGFNAPQHARLALTYLQRDLQSSSVRASHLFEGDDKSVTLFLVARPMDVEEDQGPRLMRVRYRYKASTDELIREEAMVKTALPNRPPEGKKVDPARIELSDESEFVVARNVERFELRYLWAPYPQWEDQKAPPPRVEPLIAQRNKEGWGLPTAIEVQLSIEDPETEVKQRFAQLMYLPMPRERRDIKSLNKMLGSAAE